jgi:phosphoribosylaminoimidazole carboxylase PurE protein
MLDYAESAAGRGLRVIIAGAGGSAQLPGMIAAATPLPVIGVPAPSIGWTRSTALLSIVRMPAGFPVATVSIGGGRNAGLLAVRILAACDAPLRDAFERLQPTSPSRCSSALPVAHGTWHPLYLGLSYSDHVGTEPSVLGIYWADSFGWEKAREIDPDVIASSREYDLIMKDLYLDEARAHPTTVAVMYAEKAADTIRQNVWVLAAVLAGTVLLWRRPSVGPVLRRVTLLMLPALLYGFTPPTLVMPMRYYFMELTATTGLLLAVVVAAVAAATARNPRQEVAQGGAPANPAVDEEVESGHVEPVRDGADDAPGEGTGAPSW